MRFSWMPLLRSGLAALCAALVLTACDPAAEIVSPPEAQAGTPVSFSMQLLPGVEVGEADYTWDFGDGGTATGPVASHTYAQPGTYQVTLSIANASTRQFGQAYVTHGSITIVNTPVAAASWTASYTLGACEPSGQGHDYQVGPGAGQLGSLSLVPWESLQPGDTVRIFPRAEPYRGKILVAAQGTATAPVRVCGVRGADGQRPVIDGANATSRAALADLYGHPLHQSRSIVVIKTLSGQPWTDHPSYIVLDGLEIRGATPTNTFTDAAGTVQPYEAFGACVWVERGHHVVIADNEIHDCTNGLYTKSTDDGDFAVTTDILLSRNRIHGNGVVGEVHMHDTYTASRGIVYEYNHIGPQRAGSEGNAIKDRSAGTVVRYNRIEGGAHAIDLVEAEDFASIATTLPEYRSTYVYGNQILKNSDTGSVIHYGGDHYGSGADTPHWGEPIFRKGTLFFYNNTVQLTGVEYAALFQVATTEERVEAFNNIIVFDPANPYPRLRASTDIGEGWTAGGVVNLGVNWISAGWMDSDPYHPVPGTLAGTQNIVSGPTPPVDAATLVPLAGGGAIDAGQPLVAGATAHPVRRQLDQAARPYPRVIKGTAIDLGAAEY